MGTDEQRWTPPAGTHPDVDRDDVDRDGVPVTAPTVEQTPPAAESSGGRSRRRWVLLVGALVCAVLWAVSLALVDLDAIAGWGLVNALPVLWYVSLAGVLVLYLSALLDRRSVSHAVVACHVVLVALLYGTTSAVYDVPRFAYVYKHIGVAEYLLANGSVDRSIDIYQNFPGFFYLAAGVHRLTGIPVIDLAQWSQPFFALVSAALIYWVVGALTTSRRVRYGAALLFTLGDWIAQNYFAPQAGAFVVSLVVVGGLLRTVPAGSAGVRWPRRAATAATPPADDLPQVSRFWSSWRGTAVLIVAFAYIATSHQLSPVISLVQTGVICVLLRPARPWLLLVFVAIEAAWLAQAWTFVTSRWTLFAAGGVENAAPPTIDLTQALPGQALSLWAAPVLVLLVALMAAIALFIGLRQRVASRVVVPALIGVMPAMLVFGQPYGQEAVFRMYLFALPWACYLIARVLFADRVRVPVLRRVVAVVVAAVMATLLLPALYASELIGRIWESDVAADTWFETSTPDGSLLLPMTPNFPLRATADYPLHAEDGPGSIFAQPDFGVFAEDPAGLVTFSASLCVQGSAAEPLHIVVGPSAEAHSRLYGTVPPSVYQDFVTRLQQAPAFTQVFQKGDTVVYRCNY
ncbi:hypothetical protein O2W14_13565 [Modestobacter sp. VKM Ac-2986]|uniref:hypothetical protein n=1 Tax=Modestobacter sp. VKM Ac-2986 TaxID=3004140 RepID=UPI0022AB6500|nr:hypothetical protein [Modestobacter sp. VKM Ac-2986]MCZ2829866.1 hypothetical protein [Modestobacter sp. VKM Ac-2986]